MKLPSQQELLACRNRLTPVEVSNGSITYLDMVSDLASSEAIMSAVQFPEYAAAFNWICREFDITRKSDGAPVVIFSDRNGGNLLSILRRREEHYYGFSSNWNDDEEVLAKVASDLSGAGYDTQEAP